MIKDIKLWNEFEKDLIRKTKPDYQKNLKIFLQLYEEALLLNVFPYKNSSVSLDTKVRITRVSGKSK